MDWDTFKAIVDDGGGFEKIALLVFDNSILIINRGSKSCEESDFVHLGNEWFYKEPIKMRSKKTFEYEVQVYNYHPFNCLQSVVMGDITQIDEQSLSDMF